MWNIERCSCNKIALECTDQKHCGKNNLIDFCSIPTTRSSKYFFSLRFQSLNKHAMAFLLLGPNFYQRNNSLVIRVVCAFR